MKINFLFLSLFVFGLSFQACNNDDDDDMPTPDTEEPITEQNVRAVFNFLPPSGYESTFYVEDLPASVQAGYKNIDTDQNITVVASENLSGEVIVVTDFVVESNFIEPDGIQKSTVNGTDVYQSMDQSTYRVVIFRGQYRFDILVQNDPDPAEAEAEAALFIDLVTEAMTTF